MAAKKTLAEHMIALESVGLYRCPEVNEVRPATIRPQHELVELMVSGAIRWDNGDGEQVYGQGAMFWHLAGEKTIHKTFADNPYRCLTFHFLVDGPPRRHAPRFSLVSEQENTAVWGTDILRAFHHEALPRDFIARYVFYRLRWEACRYASREAPEACPSSVLNATTYVRERLASALSVEGLAKAAGVSASHLHALFRKHLGTSPRQYIIRRRLDLARELLAGDDVRIKEISARCGFDDPESFCRSFRSHYAMTPGEYRKRHSPRYRTPSLRR